MDRKGTGRLITENVIQSQSSDDLIKLYEPVKKFLTELQTCYQSL